MNHQAESDYGEFVAQLYRCVDGELTEVEEREFLLRCDATPSGWKQLATAFVENRIVADVCRETVPGSTTAEPATPAKSTDRSRHRHLGAITAACVSLFCAFVVGRWSIPQVESIGDSSSDSASSEMASTAESTRSAGLGSPDQLVPQPVMYLSVQDKTGDELRTVRLPVYRRKQLPANWSPYTGSTVTPELQRQLAQAGINVASEKKMYAIAGPDNRPILMPVESIRLKPARF